MVKVIFAGTPEFAAIALQALLAAGYDVPLVLTQPDRPAGRGMRPRPSAVKECAIAQGLQLSQPASLKDSAVQDELRRIGATVMVVAAYGLILPAELLALPRRGCLNIHASLLPRWRGAAPIQRALLAGDAHTGITIMQMDAGLDTGAILFQETIAIRADDTAQSLHDRLALAGARCIVHALREPQAPHAQEPHGVTYAAKITKAEAVIDWTRSAPNICRQVRAFNPAPGAVTTLNGAALKIWFAEPAAHVAAAAGSIVGRTSEGIVVAAGDGAVCITELQKAGGRRIAATAFMAGAAFAPDARLGT